MLTCWRQELAGLLQSSQSAVRQQTLANRVRLLVMDIKESEKENVAVLKMDRIDRLYVRGGCTVDADGTKVYSFSFLVLRLRPSIVLSFAILLLYHLRTTSAKTGLDFSTWRQFAETTLWMLWPKRRSLAASMAVSSAPPISVGPRG